MTSSPLVLFAGVLCLAVYTCFGTSPFVEDKQACDYQAIKECNHEFKNVFRDATVASGQAVFDRGVYCKGIQVLSYFTVPREPRFFNYLLKARTLTKKSQAQVTTISLLGQFLVTWHVILNLQECGLSRRVKTSKLTWDDCFPV